MKRILDLLLVVTAMLLFLMPLLVMALIVKLTSDGSILYWSERVGLNNVIFKMPKFRSMRVGTSAVATHLLAGPNGHLTSIGSFLRKSILYDLPQLWIILAGKMSFFGSRPALFNQHDLIEIRSQQGVNALGSDHGHVLCLLGLFNSSAIRRGVKI
jgi:O-antigen biosynthesis protein WbqP